LIEDIKRKINIIEGQDKVYPDAEVIMKVLKSELDIMVSDNNYL